MFFKRLGNKKIIKVSPACRFLEVHCYMAMIDPIQLAGLLIVIPSNSGRSSLTSKPRPGDRVWG